MTDRDPFEGYFSHLDDPSWSAPAGDALPTVMRRGRQLRARRRTTFAASATLGLTAAVIGGLGISHAIQADGTNDGVFQPANSTSPTATASGRGHHRGGGNDDNGGSQVLEPRAGGGHGVRPLPGASSPGTQPSPADTCGDATGGESPPADPLAEASLPPLAPSPTPSCEPASPTPSATPTDSASPEPTDSAEPTASPT
jgi:hypothetical protein